MVDRNKRTEDDSARSGDDGLSDYVLGSALNLSIPAMEKEFGIGATMVGWIVTALYSFCSGDECAFWKNCRRGGKAENTDSRYGIFAVMSLSCAFCTDIRILLAFRIVQGFGASMIFATNNAILIGAHPADQRGRVL